MQPVETSKLGLYLSFPFCRSKCTYCNFASGVYPASEHTRYVDRLVEDIEGSRAWAKELGVDLPSMVDTIYLGGGTPSLLAPHLIERLFNAIRASFEVEPGAEITMECAPAQLSDETLQAMPTAGINRVSLGVQSFIDGEAQASGRLHKRSDVLQDLERLRAAGISNLNIDLIAGLPGQTRTSWEESLRALTDSGVPHASIYMLEVDEDSRLGKELLFGGRRYHAELVPSDDVIVQMYERAVERLNWSGLHQYEISNFSKEGSASRHNLRYWQRRPYLGLGLDASSALVAQASSEQAAESPTQCLLLRAKTTEDLNAYLDHAQPAEVSWLSAAEQFEEAWFLGLRTNTGVNLAALQKEFGAERVARALETVAKLSADGLVAHFGESVMLTPRGRLLSNEVFQEFLTGPE